MKSTFLVAATILSGIVGVVGIPTTASNTATPQSTTTSAPKPSSFHTTANSQSPAAPAQLSGTGPGPKEEWLCWSVGTDYNFGVQFGSTEKDAKAAVQSQCGSSCSHIDCESSSVCVAGAFGTVKRHDGHEAALVIDAVLGDDQQARTSAEIDAVKICESLIHGDCSSLGSACLIV